MKTTPHAQQSAADWLSGEKLMELMPAAVYTCAAPSGIITYYNRRAAELWGREPAVGDTDERFCGSFRLYRSDGTRLPHAETPMAEVLGGAAPIRGQEVGIERPDGSRIIVTVNIDPIKSAAGEIVGAINVFQNVTEERRLFAALQKSEERFRLATHAGKIGVWDWDIVNNRITWSDSLCGIHGVKPEDFDGTVEGFERLIHPEDRDFVTDRIARALQSKQSYELEFRVVRPDGNVVWVFTQAVVLREDGRSVRMLGATTDVTDRKLAELALQESELRFRTFATNAPVAIFTKDLAGRYTLANPLACQALGRPGGVAGLTDHELMPAHLADALRRHDREVAAKGIPVRGEEIVSGRWYLSVKFPWQISSGESAGVCGVAVDITDRKESEELLRKRSGRRELLSEALAELLSARDPEAVLEELFAKVAAHLGVEAYFCFVVNEQGDALRLRACAGVSDEIARSFERLEFGQAICNAAAQTPTAIVANYIRSSNDARADLARAFGIQTYACNPLLVGDRLLGTLSFASRTRSAFDDDELEFLRIVSQCTAVALDRSDFANSLRASEQRFRAVFEQATTGVALCDVKHGRFLEVNRAYCDITGYSDEELLQMTWKDITHPEDLERNLESSRAVLDGAANSYTLEKRYLRKNGATVWINLFGTLIGNQWGEPAYTIGVAVDITARKRAEQTLRESERLLRDQTKELEQQLIASGRLVSLGEVTASMAHEFNNPLGIIMGFVDEMLKSKEPSDPDYRALQIVDEESRRCQKIIRDLMEYAGPKNAEISQVTVAEVIEKTLKLVENHFYKQKIIQGTDIPADLPKIYADSQQLAQVLINLYLNAIDAMPDGGKLNVAAGLEAAEAMQRSVVITVADTGFGISPEELPKIFQPFYTARKRRGLGLGLPICERIVKNHGGRIDVQSRQGEGTAFRIYLPVKRD